MSPLRKIEGGQPDKVFDDKSEFTQYWWAHLLGVAPQSLGGAARRGGAADNILNLDGGFSIHQIPVSAFPELIKGLQLASHPATNKPYHEWLQQQKVDTSKRSFEVTTRGGNKLIYSREK